MVGRLRSKIDNEDDRYRSRSGNFPSQTESQIEKIHSPDIDSIEGLWKVTVFSHTIA